MAMATIVDRIGVRFQDVFSLAKRLARALSPRVFLRAWAVVSDCPDNDTAERRDLETQKGLVDCHAFRYR